MLWIITLNCIVIPNRRHVFQIRVIHASFTDVHGRYAFIGRPIVTLVLSVFLGFAELELGISRLVVAW